MALDSKVPAHTDFTGLRVTVMGLGRFGGGVGAVRFLADRGALVTVTDLKREEDLRDSLQAIDDCSIARLRFGGHDPADFESADLIVANPAVPPTNEFLRRAVARHIPIDTEIGLFWRENTAPVIAVTGSNGKSTTAAMIHTILTTAGIPCRFGGNIGISLLPEVDQIRPHEWVVLELSSFQLARLATQRIAPQVAVVTEFSPNHIDWHGTHADYRECKQAILRFQNVGDTAVLNRDNETWNWPCKSRRLGFSLSAFEEYGCCVDDGRLTFRSERGVEQFELPLMTDLPGRHNLQNALAAACATWAIDVPGGSIVKAIEHYQPLPHRLQFVGEAAGRKFYNDSLATTPESVCAALDSFPEPVVLLAGGSDKGVNLTTLARNIVSKTRSVILMGQTADRLQGFINREAHGDGPGCVVADSFEAAFRCAVTESQPGDVVLLSPGCASYDWFRDYEARGSAFVDCVNRWIAEYDPGTERFR